MMNGVDKEIIDRRPLVTCAGELEVFSAIEDSLSQSLPRDSAEWKRSLGRPIKSVHVGANFVPFSPIGLPKGHQWDLIRHPLFHIYWTECSDIDTYKSTLKEDIEIWLRELTSRDIQDWLIVVVENYDGRRANKLLPRTTVLDKIRADFAPKQGDRCISVINPGKSDTTESWKGLVNRTRHLLLVAYAKAVSRLEDYVRQQREKRNDLGWKFMNYFHLQEELAQVLEMLGLYDEALVQFDELDALFSQFVVNGVTSESVAWLAEFQCALERWHALKLGPSQLPTNPSILELRAYLFAKQAHMLLLTDKVWQMASRCLPFLHTCTRELSILEIASTPGALECWLFLAAREVLQTCDKFNHADEVEAYSTYTAPLWAYASQKLKSLGELCGLLPGSTPTSEQLHIVVGLSAGMGDNPGTPIAPSPTDRLKEALRSQEAFNKTYLELAELAMGTYKHTGRVRSARLLGREVAAFYVLLGETQKAAAFLGDAARLFRSDGWNEVAAHTERELADCYRLSGDWRKFIRCCAQVAASHDLDTLIRWTYFDDMRRNLQRLDKPLVVSFDDIVKIRDITLKNTGKILEHSVLDLELTLTSNFPREILCERVVVTVENEPNKRIEKYLSEGGDGRTLTGERMTGEGRGWWLRRLRMERHMDFKQDKQLASVSVVCRSESLRRKDSAPVVNADFQGKRCFEALRLPFLLTPGINVIRLTDCASEIGKYQLGQVALFIGRLQLASPQLLPRLAFAVEREEPSLRLHKEAGPLLTGIEQKMNVLITVGSYELDPSTKIKLTTSRGLSLQTDASAPLTSSCEFSLGRQAPLSSTRRRLRVVCADNPSPSSSSSVSGKSDGHVITVSCPWNVKPINVNLTFAPPLAVGWKLHSVAFRKFVTVGVTGQCSSSLRVARPRMTFSFKGIVDGGGVRAEPRFGEEEEEKVLRDGLTYTYMWEIVSDTRDDRKNGKNGDSLSAEFNVTYELEGVKMAPKTYQYCFDISDYQTQYILHVALEPSKGSEFCRVGFLCHLAVKITSVADVSAIGGSSENCRRSAAAPPPRSVMYEVLAEHGVWAVCGRTAGVVTFEDASGGDDEHRQRKRNNKEEEEEDEEKRQRSVVLEVMPLASGYLPLPLVRISKYIPAEGQPGKNETHPRLEPFAQGQVYNATKGKQVHVIVTPTTDGGGGNAAL